MSAAGDKNIWRALLFRTLLPVGLTMAMLICAFIFLVEPMFERSLMGAKREMATELVNSVYADLVHRQGLVEAGEITLEEAQSRAISRIRSLHYGPEGKNYFWISSIEPRVIMHPYRTDLEGQYVWDFADPMGNYLFRDFSRAVKNNDGSGFVDYYWQWWDDPDRIGKKISYVRLFEPWGWIVGTGLYVHDVHKRIAAITGKLNNAILVIFLIMLVISGYITWQSSIAERRRSEAEDGLRISEARYRSLTENTPDIITRFDSNGRILFISRSGQALLGRNFEDCLGKTYRQLGLDKEYCDFTESSIERVFATGKPVEAEHDHNNLGGSAIFNCRLVPESNESGQIKSVLCVSRDVTAFRRSEENYRMLFSRMLSGFALHEIVCDSAGKPVDYRFLAVNPAFERIANLSAEKVIGKTVNELLPGTESYWVETYGKVALTGEPLSFEHYSSVFGRHFEVVAFQAQPGQCACIFKDITERKAAEQERERLLKALSAKNEELESIVYVASHDLRSPLVNIDGYSREVEAAFNDLKDLLADEPVKEGVRGRLSFLLDYEIPAALEFIISSSIKMDLLLHGLLRLSRLGQASLHISQLDMNELMASVVHSMQYQIREAGVELRIEDLPPCMADAGQVNQVFTNLLDNAVKYLDSSRKGRIRISGKVEDDMAIYCVEDNGVGIAAAFMEKIFDVFHRLAPNSAVSGEGLGLTIVRRIVERLDGKVWVQSQEGVGSKFYVWLPRIKA